MTLNILIKILSEKCKHLNSIYCSLYFNYVYSSILINFFPYLNYCETNICKQYDKLVINTG